MSRRSLYQIQRWPSTIPSLSVEALPCSEHCQLHTRMLPHTGGEVGDSGCLPVLIFNINIFKETQLGSMEYIFHKAAYHYGKSGWFPNFEKKNPFLEDWDFHSVTTNTSNLLPLHLNFSFHFFYDKSMANS